MEKRVEGTTGKEEWLGIEGLKAFAKILQIAVDDHNRVIDNHSQHHN